MGGRNSRLVTGLESNKKHWKHGVYVLSKNVSIKMNFKDQIYLEKTKNPTTQRMGFTSRHLPGIKSTDYKSFS